MDTPSWAAPKVSKGAFLGHHWGAAIVSFFFVAFRIGIRLKYFRKLWVDDILIIAAWILMFATAIIYQVEATNMYKHYPLVTGQIPLSEENLANEAELLKAEVAEFFLFYSALWAVKASMLLFFRRLFWDRQHAPYLKTWWWFVTGFTVASYFACLGTIPFHCLLGDLFWIVENCAIRTGIDYVWINLQLSCATDIVTDVFIISLPIIWIRGVRLPMRNKLALAAIFSLTMITILFAIIRIGVQPNKQSSADITWLCLWAHVETGVAVIVACLASFRQLFVMAEQSSAKKSSGSYNSSKWSFGSRKRSNQGSYPSYPSVSTKDAYPLHSTEHLTEEVASKAYYAGAPQRTDIKHSQHV